MHQINGDFLLILIAAWGDPTDCEPSYKKPWMQRPGAIPLKVIQPPTPCDKTVQCTFVTCDYSPFYLKCRQNFASLLPLLCRTFSAKKVALRAGKTIFRYIIWYKLLVGLYYQDVSYISQTILKYCSSDNYCSEICISQGPIVGKKILTKFYHRTASSDWSS